MREGEEEGRKKGMPLCYVPRKWALAPKKNMEEEEGREEVEVEHEIWGNILIRALFLPVNRVLQPRRQIFPPPPK